MKPEEEIEKLSHSMLKTIDSISLLTTTKEEENIFHQGFYSGYRKCEKDMQKDVEYWQGEFDHWHNQAMDISNKTFTKEQLIECMVKATRWDTFNEDEPEYKMDMSEFFEFIISKIKK